MSSSSSSSNQRGTSVAPSSINSRFSAPSSGSNGNIVEEQQQQINKQKQKKPRGENNNNDGNSNEDEPSQENRRKATPLLMKYFFLGLSVCFLLSASSNIFLLHADTFQQPYPSAGAGSNDARTAADGSTSNSVLRTLLADFKRGRTKSLRRIEQEMMEYEKEVGEEGEDEREEELIHNQGEEFKGEEELIDVDEIRHGTADIFKSKIGSLDCAPYDNHEDQHNAAKVPQSVLDEMIYWHDIPSDQLFVSPMKKKTTATTTNTNKNNERQFLTFEPDGGGWNNIRMAMETIVGLAIAMGRTLVLPPAQGMYLLKKDKTQQNTDFSFAHFFPMHEMAYESEGLDLITTEEYLTLTWGKLVDKNTGQISYPPDNRTNWDGQDVKVYKEWLRNVTYTEHMWKPSECMAAFPASGNHKDVEFLNDLLQNDDNVLNPKQIMHKFKGHAVPVDAPPLQRLQENLAGRKQLCVYDEKMQSQHTVHFMCYHKMRIRYLVHFYAFLFFEDWRQDVWMKRFMRDHMRYIDEIQCAAARIVAAIHEAAQEKFGSGHFDTMHIRRGDFQFKDTRIEATEILDNSRDVLSLNKTLYLATDERDKKFFQPFRTAGYHILFLDDFKPLLKGVNTNYYGMIDQLIASKGDVFLGCWHSTFTGFIMRMRGYHSTKRKDDGYLDGILPTSYYYATLNNKYAMHEYTPLIGGFFNREFPTSWRQIDAGVAVMDDNEHHAKSS